MLDVKAVREAAERIQKANRVGVAPVYALDGIALWHSDLCHVAITLTDPTPLTVEMLVECGGIENPKSELCYKFGAMCVYADGPPEAWEWTYGNDGLRDVPPWLNPRTVGELRQLLARMEG